MDSNSLKDGVGALAYLRSRSLSSLLWKLLERGGNALVQMVVQVVMARLLVPEDFGALAIMLVFVNVGNVLVQSGLNTALIQAERVDEGSYSTVFWMSLAVSLVLYAACFVAAPAIASAYDMSRIVWPLRALCLVLVVNAYNAVQVAKVTRDLEMRKTFVSTIASVTVSGVLGAGSAIAGAGLWALVVQQLSYQVVNCAVMALQVDWHPTLVFRADEALSLLRFGWKLLASGLLDTGYNSLSDLVVGARFSAASLGIMSQGKKYPQALAGAINGAVQPVMLSTVAHVSSDRERAKAVTRRALKSSCYVVMPVMCAAACVAPSLLPLLLGPHWVPAVPYFQVFCLSSALLPIHTTNLQSINAMGRSDLFLKLEVVKKAYGVANLLLCAFVLNDVWLLCCSYLLTGLVSTVVNAWPNREVLGYPVGEQAADLAPGVLLSAAASAVALAVGLLPLPAAALAALQALAFGAAYLGLSALLRVEAFTYLVGVARGLLRRGGAE